jgi:hypothetical protein
MTRIHAILVLLLAFSSICFGATLMQLSVAKAAQDSHTNAQNRSSQYDQSCQRLIKEHQNKALKKAAVEIYQEAFTLSFKGEHQKAKEASVCAAHLINGTDHWRVEAKDLIR